MNLVTNIQKYSIHDGDGIRTTVFFKRMSIKVRVVSQTLRHSVLREKLRV